MNFLFDKNISKKLGFDFGFFGVRIDDKIDMVFSVKDNCVYIDKVIGNFGKIFPDLLKFLEGVCLFFNKEKIVFQTSKKSVENIALRNGFKKEEFELVRNF